MTGIEAIAQERQEQIEKHGRSIEDDVKYNDLHQLSLAAFILLSEYDAEGDNIRDMILPIWQDSPPSGWNIDLWKTMLNKPYDQRLVIAGALIAAEIDRLNVII